MNIDDFNPEEVEVIDTQPVQAVQGQEASRALNIDDIDESEIEVLPDTPVFESALRGAAQGLTLGHADEISGAVEAAFTDKPYEQARNESREAFERAREDNPLAFQSSEVISGVAGAIAAGPAALGVRGAVAFGAIQALGESEEDDIEDLIIDSVAGGALGLGGDLLFGEPIGSKLKSGIGKVANRLKDVARSEADILGFKSLGITNKAHVKRLTNTLKNKGQNTTDFLDRFSTEVDVNGEPLLTTFKGQEELLVDVLDRRSQLSDEIGGYLKQVDIENGGSINLDPNELADHLQESIIDPLINGGATSFEEQQLAEKLLKRTDFIRNQKNWSLTDLNNWKVKLGKTLNFAKRENTDLALNGKLRETLTSTIDFIHDKIQVHSNDPALLDSFKETKLKFGTLADAEGFIEDSVAANKKGFIGNIRRAFSTFGSAGVGGIAGGVPGVVLGGAFDLASKSPTVNRALSKKLKEISNFSLSSPQAPELGRYLKLLNDSSVRGSDAFENAIDLIHRNINGEIIDKEEENFHRSKANGSGYGTSTRLRLNEEINNKRIPSYEEADSEQPFLKSYKPQPRDGRRKKREVIELEPLDI